MAATARYTRRAFSWRNVFLNRKNPLKPFDYTELIRKHRFPSWAILQQTDMLEQSIAHPSSRSGTVPVLLQVGFETLRYLASGSFQDIFDEHLGLHQKTECWMPLLKYGHTMSGELLKKKPSCKSECFGTKFCVILSI
ncbi:low quality protein: putative nuclease harbi1 [Plakobranchus ocellatus]|uniref:Low quality protein: putative nuclease harbi1 n=1 Tax=Plakobranchus ocellatus TaxID=259542 RepID=A0AAV3YSG2_9GAST|nr:low quality protein: putative nuclease harbi1 [Plakobranchus ocellatus]